VVAVAIGAGFGFVALGKQKDAEPHCHDGNKCDADGVALRAQGLTASHLSTGLFVGGAALVAVGIVLVVIPPATPSPKDVKPSVSLMLAPAPGGMMIYGGW
jgi:hypothetical protein